MGRKEAGGSKHLNVLSAINNLNTRGAQNRIINLVICLPKRGHFVLYDPNDLVRKSKSDLMYLDLNVIAG